MNDKIRYITRILLEQIRIHSEWYTSLTGYYTYCFNGKHNDDIDQKTKQNKKRQNKLKSRD